MIVKIKIFKTGTVTFVFTYQIQMSSTGVHILVWTTSSMRHW